MKEYTCRVPVNMNFEIIVSGNQKHLKVNVYSMLDDTM